MRSDIKIANATIAQSNQCIIIFKTTVKTVISGCFCFGTKEPEWERDQAKNRNLFEFKAHQDNGRVQSNAWAHIRRNQQQQQQRRRQR